MVTIPTKFTDDFNKMMDAFIIDPFCITATLMLPPRKIKCTTCSGVRDPIGNKPSNTGWSGRPKPYSGLGNCAMCNGEGFIQEEVTEDICVRPYWSEREWILPTQGRVRAGTINNREVDSAFAGTHDLNVQIKTFMYNLPKILNATHLKFSKVPGLDPYRIYSFSLEGEPWPHGLGHNRYCLSMWKRATSI